jgi:hypothetical protein
MHIKDSVNAYISNLFDDKADEETPINNSEIVSSDDEGDDDDDKSTITNSSSILSSESGQEEDDDLTVDGDSDTSENDPESDIKEDDQEIKENAPSPEIKSDSHHVESPVYHAQEDQEEKQPVQSHSPPKLCSKDEDNESEEELPNVKDLIKDVINTPSKKRNHDVLDEENEPGTDTRPLRKIRLICKAKPTQAQNKPQIDVVVPVDETREL